ncbi:hypothetical protein Leryth_011735 [Lithospermum erythrorhizon]|nr:hypothetical protein Leryth_011735 [Lithospermum erythrorhizon]
MIITLHCPPGKPSIFTPPHKRPVFFISFGTKSYKGGENIPEASSLVHLQPQSAAFHHFDLVLPFLVIR